MTPMPLWPLTQTYLSSIFIFYFLKFLCCKVVLAFLFAFPTSTNPTHILSQADPHMVVCVQVLYINVLWLNLSLSFIPSLPLLFWKLFLSFMYLSFCYYSLVYCIHYILHISEIMWYFSFTNWFNSLNIIFSTSIHAFAKGKSFSFFIAEQYSIV